MVMSKGRVPYPETYFEAAQPEINIAVTSSFPPFSFDGKPSEGIVADYLKLIQHKLKLDYRIVPTDNDGSSFELLRQNKVDAVIPSFDTTDNGEKNRLTYFQIPTVIISRNSNHNIHSIHDLSSQHVVTLTSQDVLLDISKNYPSLKISPAKNINTALYMLIQDKAEALITNLATANYITHYLHKNEFFIISEIPFPSQFYFAFPPDKNLLYAQFDKILDTIPIDAHHHIIKKWIDIPSPEDVLNHELIIGIILILGILILIIYWNRRLSREINKRKKMEISLRNAKEEADSANREKSQFLTNMSHEIRTPINAVMGLSYLALQTSENKEQRLQLTKVISASESLLNLINHLLDFSKLRPVK